MTSGMLESVSIFVRRMFFRLFGVYYVLEYYSGHLQHGGLIGRDALQTWRARVFAEVNVGRITDAPIVWIHAAGPGDAKAAIVLMEELVSIDSEIGIYVTYGSSLARAHVVEQTSVRILGHSWLPFDCAFSSRRFLQRLQPTLYVAMQDEYWPTLLNELSRQKIPSIMLRVYGFRWEEQEVYPQFLRAYYQFLLGKVTRFSTRSEIEADNLARLGISRQRIVIGGDYRLIYLPGADHSKAAVFRERLNLRSSCRLVVLVGFSINEIELLLPILLHEVNLGRLRVLIAPVEKEVLTFATKRLQKLRVDYSLWSQTEKCLTGVIVLDTHGELFQLYSVAKVAIIGETFAGGVMPERNYWEPLVQGVGVIAGPFFKCGQMVESLYGFGGVTVVNHLDAFEAELQRMVLSASKRSLCLSRYQWCVLGTVGMRNDADMIFEVLGRTTGRRARE